MDLVELGRKLVAAARSNAPSEAVPYAFEKRVMARITLVPRADEWLWWNRALWRGAAACAAIALLLSAWSRLGMNQAAGNGSIDLEEALVASVDQADVN